MEWVSINDRLPPFDWPTLLWGDKLDPNINFPLMGRLCASHEDWVLDWFDDAANSCIGVYDSPAFTERMLGNVTHWLDWKAPDAK